jgi:hypothetical protein
LDILHYVRPDYGCGGRVNSGGECGLVEWQNVKRIYVKFFDQTWLPDNWHWKLLCWVPDSEALGIVERMLSNADCTFKVEDGKSD